MKRDELILRAVDAVNGVLRGCTLSAEDAARLRNFLWDEVQRVTKPNEKGIVVPGEMLRAGLMARVGKPSAVGYVTPEEAARDVLEGALRWLSENPIMPTDQQWQDLFTEFCHTCQTGRRNPPIESQIKFTVIEWQRRMFLAPEPEVPEAVKDLLFGKEPLRGMSGLYVESLERGFSWNEAVLEAFRRGQKEKR